ncbi:MAG TPA: DUF4255 domain-containing protein [Acidimicrobiales bacterium]|nr:DUF4255 domain-containing protein [Acidimicrobiales bacterium]
MATFRGLAAVGTGVLTLLEDAWARDPFVPETMETSLIRAEDLKERPFEFGVTVYVYRVAVNGTQRTPVPTVTATATTPRRRRPLPVEVDLVVTAWGLSAERELELLGWCMRAIDDEPLLSPAVLNRAVPGVFGPSETAELVANPLPLDEYYRLWDALPWDYQLSAAYTARVVRLESSRTVTEAGPVLERDLDHRALELEGADA